ncbi:hypothetical protein JCM10914A_42380 [Paenibacillus sp. JCM 10914]|uniref:hypothetical protein n=1 Tax=Paenibacillus sp. JCM 10914 TaxID=1236974 RepID=UPI0003CC8B02|nr:hypothetical protein [Paenibacillus sp. JCM 10914]GAE05455.1 hypothetical protein JCM10914_1557 [Paenibacillus sp. JCM 10914]
MSSQGYNHDKTEPNDQASETDLNKAINHLASCSSIEPKQQSWQQLKQQLDQRRKRKQRKYHFQMACVIAASVALGAVLFPPLTATQAVTPIYQEIKDWGNGVVGQIFGRETPITGTALTNPPPGPTIPVPAEDVLPAEVIDVKTSEFIEKDEALPESRKRALFQIPVFEYIPDIFTFHEANALLIGR